MNLFFQNAHLWPLAALIGVPILVHLFARARPPVYHFSSVEFIRRVVRQTLRIKRPQDILLLVVRTLLALILLGLFLRPLLTASDAGPAAFQQRHVVVVVDATASMACSDGAQTRFAMACASASELLAGLTARDTANIIWLKAVPEAVFPERSGNMAYLRDALRRATVSAEAGDVGAAMRLAGAMLAAAEGYREICIVSDFQASAWRPEDGVVPAGVALVQVRIGSGDPENVAITGITLDPPEPLRGEETFIHGEICNYSAQPLHRPVHLRVGAYRETRSVMIPAYGKAMASFSHRFNETGEQTIEVALDADSFTVDDRRWAVCGIRENLRVTVTGNDTVSAAICMKALDALGWIRSVRAATVDAAAMEGDALWLAGWQGEGAAQLSSWVGQGRTVICTPADGLALETLGQALGLPMEGTGTVRWQSGGASRRLRVAAPDDALFGVFAGGQGDPARARFEGRPVMTAPGRPERLLDYDDGQPALLRYRFGRGQFYLWNMTLDPKQGTLARQPEWIPLVGELLLQGRSGLNVDSDTARPGYALALASDDAESGGMSLCSADGTALELREDRSGVTFMMVSDPIRQPGLYRWERQGRTLSQMPVNFPEQESDLRAMKAVALTPQSLTVQSGSRVQRLRDGVPIWPHLWWLGLALALVEGALLVTFGGRGSWTKRDN